MPHSTLMKPFQPLGADEADIVSWIHIGDLHMTRTGEQNHLDLIAIVQQINREYAQAVSFVYLPGDVAEHGKVEEYRIVQPVLQSLKVPWCSILGDHDLHEKTYEPYLQFMARDKYYSFDCGPVCFAALNAFDSPDPGAFCVHEKQFAWLEHLVQQAQREQKSIVLLLHCYPTDLKQGFWQLQKLVKHPSVRLVEMGHTHYNELANDGSALYIATRSTGQVEEGPVGFSITNIDRNVISWKFVALQDSPVVMITSPADERFLPDTCLPGQIIDQERVIRAKAWSKAGIETVVAAVADQTIPLSQVPRSNVWQAEIAPAKLLTGVHPLTVTVRDKEGSAASDTIRAVIGASSHVPPVREPRDQNNTIAPWHERGLLGTQLGPNKNGRKW